MAAKIRNFSFFRIFLSEKFGSFIIILYLCTRLITRTGDFAQSDTILYPLTGEMGEWLKPPVC